jgi:PAS domain S-box-containing protein
MSPLPQQKLSTDHELEQRLREMNEALLISSVRQHELTEQAQKAEQAVRESEEQFRRMIEEAPIPIIMQTEDGEVLQVSRSWTELTGYKVEDDSARKSSEDPKMYGQGGNDLRNAVQRLFDSGQAMRAVEFDLLTRGGKRRVWWFSASAPGRLRNGRRFIVGMAEDVTDRRRAEQALQESERFRKVADSSPIMIWMMGTDGKALFLNREYREFFGIVDQDPASFDWQATIHPDDREGYISAFAAAIKNPEPFCQRCRMRRWDGQWRWVQSRGNPLLVDNDNMVGLIGSSPDITDIYESEQALKDLDKRKDEFIANMSHEIRSPLTGIMGYADILLSKLKDPLDIECLMTIKKSGDYLMEIVNDILDLSKIEAGKLVLNIEPISPRALLGEIHALMHVRASEKKLPLSLRYDSVLPGIIETDRRRLRQILVNLVSNAVKFTEIGSVQIVARYLDENCSLQIEVIDTGIGIAPEHQTRLFDPFVQADTTNTRHYGGSGLGLTITKRLVEMLGGSISFESQLGKGSTFRVMIPTVSRQYSVVE